MHSNIRHSHHHTISFSRYVGYPLGGGYIHACPVGHRLQEPLLVC